MKNSGELASVLKTFATAKKKASPKGKKGDGSDRNRTAMGRSVAWLSAAGRQAAAEQAGLSDLTGPAVRLTDGRGFDAQQDARALPGESDTQFKALLSLWKRVEADDLPGFFFWHKVTSRDLP